MTDDELEEICTSRGFELVRETDTVYNHQQYVDAASECLQIEADLEEILEKHPEILEDVKRESDRMMNERDRLLDKLHEQQGTVFSIDQQTHNDTATIDEDEGEESETILDNASDGGTQSTPGNDNKPIFDLKEIKPALKSFALIAKDMGMTTYTMARRYLMAFMNQGGGNDVSQADNENISDESDKSSENSQQHNDTATIDEYEESETIADSNVTGSDSQSTPDNNQNELNFDLKEITIEVIEQMKSDMTQVVNFLVPEKLREQAKQHVQPVLKSVAVVAKDMGMTTYGMARRYFMAFMNKREGDGESVAGDDSLSDENDGSSEGEQSATAAS